MWGRHKPSGGRPRLPAVVVEVRSAAQVAARRYVRHRVLPRPSSVSHRIKWAVMSM